MKKNNYIYKWPMFCNVVIIIFAYNEQYTSNVLYGNLNYLAAYNRVVMTPTPSPSAFYFYSDYNTFFTP